MPARTLEMVHLQLTKRCNLHCWFCGQWGEHGAFQGKAGNAMTTEDWLRVVESLREAEHGGAFPSVTLWGGEPLLSESFEPVARRLWELGAPMGLVTNGTLLDRHLPLCREAFRQIYISLDGLPAVHDAIRGPGVYAKVSENLKQLRGGAAKITLMSVLTPELARTLPETLAAFETLQPDEVLLQTRIGLQPAEISNYRHWLQTTFGQEAKDIDAWSVDGPMPPLPEAWQDALVSGRHYPFTVRYLPHGGETSRPYCLSPFRHAHISWNGAVGFCTDFSDFTLGDVRKTPLAELFNSELAQRFADEVQNGRCVTCNHCSWRNSETFAL